MHKVTAQTKKSIRAVFEEAGCPYDTKLLSKGKEAIKFVKPLHIGDDPVRWWKAAPEEQREQHGR